MNLHKILSLLFLTLFLSSCDNEPQLPSFNKKYLLGRWELAQAVRNHKRTETLTGTYYEFGKNGKMKTNLTPDLSEKQYSYDFDGRAITQKGTECIVYQIDSLSESTLIFSMNINNYPFQLMLNKVIDSVDAQGGI